MADQKFGLIEQVTEAITRAVDYADAGMQEAHVQALKDAYHSARMDVWQDSAAEALRDVLTPKQIARAVNVVSGFLTALAATPDDDDEGTWDYSGQEAEVGDHDPF